MYRGMLGKKGAMPKGKAAYPFNSRQRKRLAEKKKHGARGENAEKPVRAYIPISFRNARGENLSSRSLHFAEPAEPGRVAIQRVRARNALQTH